MTNRPENPNRPEHPNALALVILAVAVVYYTVSVGVRSGREFVQEAFRDAPPPAACVRPHRCARRRRRARRRRTSRSRFTACRCA